MYPTPPTGVEYLIRQKFRASISGQDFKGRVILKAKNSTEEEKIIIAMNEYRNELEAMPAENLQRLLEETQNLEKIRNEQEKKLRKEKQEAEEKERRGQEERELKQFLSLERIRPKYDYWSKMARWKPDEAIALTVNLDPSVMNMKGLPSHILDYLSKQVMEITEIVGRAVAAYELNSPMKPEKYLEWAKRRRIDFPEQLATLILSRDIAPKPLAKPLANQEKPLGTRERETLLKIILSMALDKYKYDPDAAKCGGVTRIVNSIRLAGFDISDDTVRAKLLEAEQYMSEDYKETL